MRRVCVDFRVTNNFSRRIQINNDRPWNRHIAPRVSHGEQYIAELARFATKITANFEIVLISLFPPPYFTLEGASDNYNARRMWPTKSDIPTNSQLFETSLSNKLSLFYDSEFLYDWYTMARSRKVHHESEEESLDSSRSNNKERRRQNRRSKERKSSSDDESSAIMESIDNADLLDLVQRKKWDTVLYRVLKEPDSAFIKFTGRSSNSPSAGNLLLHEVCKKNPPMDIVEALIESNEEAVTTKGHSGYLPFHYACAHGASIDLIRLLLSLHPEAIKTVDDEEGILPLHLACKLGITKEEVYMCLLMAYPESSMIRDQYGRLPMDYAKSIRKDSHRKVAIQCLKRATWLETAAQQAREQTEADFQKRIKGYEQFQAQQLKTIEEVHTQEIADLEAKVEHKEEELAEKCQELKELDKHLQEMADEFRKRAESTDKATKAKNRKLQLQLEDAEEEAAKSKKELELKDKHVGSLLLKLEEVKSLNDSLKQQLVERTEELDLAMDDVDTMTKHTEWLQSVKKQIEDLVTSESPVRQVLPKRESRSKKRSTSKKNRTSRSVSSNRSPSVSSRRSSKPLRSPSVSSKRSEKMLRGSSPRVSSRKNNFFPADDDSRDPLMGSRLTGSYRE